MNQVDPHRSYFRKIFITLAFIFLSGCAGQGTFTYISPNYKTNSISRANVLVLPFITEFMSPNQRMRFYENKNRLHRPITSKEINLIDNYLPLILQERTPATITVFETQKISDTITLAEDSLTTEDGRRFPVFVPEKTGLNYSDAVPDFLFLVLKHYFTLFIGRFIPPCITSSLVTFPSASNSKLIFRCPESTSNSESE